VLSPWQKQPATTMIESFFRQLKHAWLFAKALGDLATVRRLTEAT
jgi:hypothetical protein